MEARIGANSIGPPPRRAAVGDRAAAAPIAQLLAGVGAARCDATVNAHRAGGVVDIGSVDPAIAPAAVGALAFDPMASGDLGPWAGWPRSRLFAPAIAFARGPDGETRAIVDVPIGDDLDPEALTAEIGRLIAAELEAVASTSSASAGASTGDPANELAAESRPGRRAWCAIVEEARGAVRSGAASKIVPARAMRFEAPTGRRFDAVATLHELRLQSPDAFVYGLGLGALGAFVGAAPELLVRVSGRTIVTEAVAGTAPRALDDPAEDARRAADLLADPKEREEHAVVVDALRDALGPLCDQLDVPDVPEVMRLPLVMHLRTPIRGHLACDASVLDLVSKLHPTPAVAGRPRAAAEAWIRAHEAIDRGPFAGPVGWVDAAGGGVFAVGIRSALVRPDAAWAWAGAGVVAGSDPASEWRETTHKLATVRRALRLKTLP